MDKLVGFAFRIVLLEDTEIWVGADNIDNCAVKQVITNGQMQTWSLKGDCLVLDENWYSAKVDDKLVVRLDKDCTKWTFEEVEPRVYRIRVPGTNLAWSAPLEAGKPVIFSPVGSVDPKYQLFRIEPLE